MTKPTVTIERCQQIGHQLNLQVALTCPVPPVYPKLSIVFTCGERTRIIPMAFTDRDGTTLRAESYVAELGKDVAEKNDKTYQKNYGVAENIKMGDSKNTVEILHVNFKPEDAAYNGIAYNLDTTKLPDGKVTISGSTGEQSQTVDLLPAWMSMVVVCPLVK